MLFFGKYVIFNEFMGPSGLRLATLLGAKESNKGALSPRCPQEGPWEGFGVNFEWILELFICIFFILFVGAFGVEFLDQGHWMLHRLGILLQRGSF